MIYPTLLASQKYELLVYNKTYREIFPLCTYFRLFHLKKQQLLGMIAILYRNGPIPLPETKQGATSSPTIPVYLPSIHLHGKLIGCNCWINCSQVLTCIKWNADKNNNKYSV